MKFTPNQRNVVAAVFGRSNMGMGHPTVDEVRRLFKQGNCSLGSAVVALCESFMESDEHYSWFMEEANSWRKEKKTETLESIQAIWPDLGKLFEKALTDEPA